MFIQLTTLTILLDSHKGNSSISWNTLCLWVYYICVSRLSIKQILMICWNTSPVYWPHELMFYPSWNSKTKYTSITVVLACTIYTLFALKSALEFTYLSYLSLLRRSSTGWSHVVTALAAIELPCCLIPFLVF